jgi:MraZ protein
MHFLTGTVCHQMDAKNRIRIPAKYKNAFPKEETLYFVQYNPGRIAVMPESVLSKKMSVFEEMDPGDQDMMDAMTAMMARTEEVNEDSQGRTQLPLSVRKHAGLKKDVVTVGMGSFIEIWDQDSYEKVIAEKPMSTIISALYKKKQDNA